MSEKPHIKLPTPIDYFGEFETNKLYIKRDDLTDIAFGGNKARKMQYFIRDALSNQADCIVTYGAVQSNHCRITSAVATMHGLEVYLIQPETESNQCFNGNALLNSVFDAKIISTPLNAVADTIEKTMQQLKTDRKSVV